MATLLPKTVLNFTLISSLLVEFFCAILLTLFTIISLQKVTQTIMWMWVPVNGGLKLSEDGCRLDNYSEVVCTEK